MEVLEMKIKGLEMEVASLKRALRIRDMLIESQKKLIKKLEDGK